MLRKKKKKKKIFDNLAYRFQEAKLIGYLRFWKFFFSYSTMMGHPTTPSTLTPTQPIPSKERSYRQYLIGFSLKILKSDYPRLNLLLQTWMFEVHVICLFLFLACAKCAKLLHSIFFCGVLRPLLRQKYSLYTGEYDREAILNKKPVSPWSD